MSKAVPFTGVCSIEPIVPGSPSDSNRVPSSSRRSATFIARGGSSGLLREQSATSAPYVSATSAAPGHEFPVEFHVRRHGSVDTTSVESDEAPCILSFLIMRENNHVRRVWSFLFVGLLLYTATVLPYRIAFIDLRIKGSVTEPLFWRVAATVVDYLFWIDLVINFFFSFRSPKDGTEVMKFREIAKRYLASYFLPNLVACLPPEAIIPIVELFSSDDSNDSGDINRGARLARLQRVSKLARLLRLTKFAGLAGVLMSSQFWKRVRTNRLVRVANFVTGLLWVVHFLACGWYLVAAAHKNPDETWLARRSDIDEVPLLDKGPADQWVHSCYFVLTVFTTVGFGDISANTTGEIAYTSGVMLLGAVINGIIVSEVINVITSIDEDDLEIGRRKILVEHFCAHTQLEEDMLENLTQWAEKSVGFMGHVGFDREKLKEMLVNSPLPKGLLDNLPQKLFEGELSKNQLLSVAPGITHMFIPPRLSIMLSMSVVEMHCDKGMILYSKHDQPFNIFLVLEGIFAYIVEEMVPAKKDSCAQDSETSVTSRAGRVVSTVSTGMAKGKTTPLQLFGFQCYFGDIEIFLGSPRLVSARCEEQGQANTPARVLILPKKELQNLEGEFPQIASAWRITATRRRWGYKKLLDRHKHLPLGHHHRDLNGQEFPDYKVLAVRSIQLWWRKRQVGGEESFGMMTATAETFLKAAGRLVTTPSNRRLSDSVHQRDVLNLRYDMMQEVRQLRELMVSSITSLRQDLGLPNATPAGRPSASAGVQPSQMSGENPESFPL